MNFFNNEEEEAQKKAERLRQFENQKFTGFMGMVDAVQQYSNKGSGSLKGPLAGFPWITTIFLVFTAYFVNLFVTNGTAPTVE